MTPNNYRVAIQDFQDNHPVSELINKSQIYLVGGAVRDRLLDLCVTERDWVVVGKSAALMKEAGFTQVGKDFPVFLHPETHEEYALARTERKTRPGHTGFVVNASPDVTLEQDLSRRDLTINAIAEDHTGRRIDPYGGVKDLEARILRHISPAFAEDPLRILRLARFYARFFHLGFVIADETRVLCKDMVSQGALGELAIERIFQELQKSLATTNPQVFFSFLDEIGAAAELWPEIREPSWQRLAHSLQDTSVQQRFAILFIDCPDTLVKARCAQLKTPKSYSDLAYFCSSKIETWLLVESLDANAVMDLLNALDAFRKPDRFAEFCDTCARANGASARQCQQHWLDYFSCTAKVSAADVDSDVQGADIGKAMTKLKIDAIARYQEAQT